MSRHPDITLGILAGGAGSRVGGRDKGWIEVDGSAQIERVLAAYRDNVGAVVISANRSLERYRALGVDVVSDDVPGYPGPLAGLVQLLAAARTPWLLTLPVDVADEPQDLVDRLAAARCSGLSVVAADAGGLQPLVACYPVALAAESARAAFAAGERSVRAWQGRLGCVHLTLVQPLGNRNTP